MKKQTNEFQGYAACTAVAEPLRIPRVGARFVKSKGLIRTKVCVDFAGTLRDGSGRSFVCDFKQTAEQYRYPTGNPTKLAPHQLDELLRHGRNNAVAGLLIESTSLRRQYWCDWRRLAAKWASIPFDDMIDLGPSNVVADLSVVLTPATAGKDER